MNTAVVFPGQGSQRTGMLAELAAEHAIIQTTFAEAADVLGTDYWAMSQTGPDEVLSDTRNTQPLMFISDIAMWRLLNEQNMATPVAIAGHSLGEFAAMVAASAMTFEEGLKLVAKRAQLMAAAVPEGEGGMAALIGMDDDAVIALCEKLSGDRVIEAVNFNAPGQIAISGHLDALHKLIEVAKEHGARKAIMLPVSVPNHSSLMRAAGESLAETISTINWKTPAIPLLQNATANVAANQDVFLSTLRQHVYNPVRWTNTIQNLRDHHNVLRIIECGPGKVLTGLGKRIDKTLPTLASETPDLLATLFDSQAEPA
ncbi:MAG: ACP S-malonyltransferase [Granulosicoccaceae bacterium]